MKNNAARFMARGV